MPRRQTMLGSAILDVQKWSPYTERETERLEGGGKESLNTGLVERKERGRLFIIGQCLRQTQKQRERERERGGEGEGKRDSVKVESFSISR
jgi:hypothetical protein